MTAQVQGKRELFDPAGYSAGPAYEVLEDMRARGPVHVYEQPHQTLYSLVNHADVVRANKDAETFSSAKNTTFTLLNPPEDFETFRAQMQMMMLNMDEPRHGRLRKLVSAGFAPGMIRRLTEQLAVDAHDIVTRALEKGDIDLVDDVAAQLPLIAICRFLGVPESDHRRILLLSNSLMGHEDPEYVQSKADQERNLAELFMYAQGVAAHTREHPSDNIPSALLAAEVDGEKLSDLEFNMFFLLLLNAGTETTRNSIAHGMRALLRHPDQLETLRADPTKLDRAIEEILRWATPVMQFRRQTTRDVEVAGTHIPEDSGVILWYTAANRDPAVFEDPYRFDIGRRPNHHVAFGGGGNHFCLGANLARAEMKLMFSELLQRADWEETGEPEFLQSTFVHGVKRLPFRLTAR